MTHRRRSVGATHDDQAVVWATGFQHMPDNPFMAKVHRVKTADKDAKYWLIIVCMSSFHDFIIARVLVFMIIYHLP